MNGAARHSLLLPALAVTAIGVGPPAARAAEPFPSPTPREFYREPAWQPRAHPTYAEVTGTDFHPAPPALPAPVTYDTPGFAAKKLRPPPVPGVHPRVLVTPEDVADIRRCVEQGNAAPPEFRTLWERLKESRSPFYALVADDDALGKALARQFTEMVRKLEPKIDRIDAQPDAANIWSAERSLIASGDPDPPHEIWKLLDYDYLHHWLSPEERAEAEQLIARLVKDRYSNYLAEPDHFMINNHKGFGMEFIRLLLLLEGRPGFPETTFQASIRKARAMLDWFLSPDGMCFESIKGWLNTSAFVAVGRRDRDFLRHDHLAAKMRFFLAALRFENGRWVIREEMRASAFHVIWLMRFLYPEDPRYDFLYHATLSTHPFLTDSKARWPDPVGVAPELLLLFAGGGPDDNRAGKVADWNRQESIDDLELPLTWKDDQRGYVEARNSWRIGDLHLAFVNKQDFFYGGHEGSEANRLTLWKDGVNWLRDEDLLAVKATGLQNMLTVDGRGLAWPPVPGVWLGVNEGPHGLSAAGDARLAYSYGKVMQVHPLDSPSGALPYYAPFAEKSFDLARDLQVAFHPGTVAFNDGYAHTDYGPWSGETRLVEHYKTNNPMERAYRTVHLARGEHPYVLVIDDAAKPDENQHFFEASFNLPDDILVVDSKTAEVQFQNVEPSSLRQSEFLFATGDTPRDPETGRPMVKKGDPLLLARVLHRNSAYGYPVPHVRVLPGRPEQPFKGFSQLVVPAISRSPEFRIMFYPHRHGDPLPETKLTGNTLEVNLGENRDTYRFATTDGGRTVFDFQRNNQPALPNPVGPARPVLVVRGDRHDPNDLRTTRREGLAPDFLFSREIQASFERISPPAEIRYTLDGSEPTESSPVYSAPLKLKESRTLRARIFDPAWPGDNRVSAETTADFAERTAPTGTLKPPANSQPGLLARVYEMNTKMWDDRGFFRADKIMLPDLDQSTPLVTAQTDGFVLPHVVPAAPIEKQTKGFYRFNGWFHASEEGVYEFSVDSCGPVLLTIAGQDAIDETGVFHQQQAERQGCAVLGLGWHTVQLTVTDPVFWNKSTHGIMPFSVKVRAPSEKIFSSMRRDQLAAVTPPGAVPARPETVWLAPESPPQKLEPGVIRRTYKRSGQTRSRDYLDIDNATPHRQEKRTSLEDNANHEQVVVYDGWFHAPMDGVYTFGLPTHSASSQHLGKFRSVYQNQLRLGNEVVVQHGVAGRLPPGTACLKTGWYPLSLRLGSSPAALSVTYPDGQTMPLEAENLQRETMIIFAPRPASDDLIAQPDFHAWNGKPGVADIDEFSRVWFADFARRVKVDGRIAMVSTPYAPREGPGGVDINMTRGPGRVPLKLQQLPMLDPAFSVGLWFRSDTGNGMLFGKQGLTAYGKRYRTVSLQIADGTLRATPGIVQGGEVKTGVWHHAVLTATPDRLVLYLDGKAVAEAPGTPDLATDALDFLPDHAGALSGLRVYNRELSAEDVSEWFRGESR